MSSSNGKVNQQFEVDCFPGRPRILFIGLPENSHTQSWIDLLQGAQFNIRLFSMPTGVPPDEWQIPTYVTVYASTPSNAGTRRSLYSPRNIARFTKRGLSRLVFGSDSFQHLQERWLAKILKRWQPDIIHTLGIEQGGEFYLHVRRKYGLEGIGKWVLQTRGGSDLALAQFNPDRRIELTDVLKSCDQLISDNDENFRIARDLGVSEKQLAINGPIPGTGGVHVDSMRQKWVGPTSSRRSIIWPKAYDSPWAKMPPILEALKLCWDRIQPCEIHMFSMFAPDLMWYWTLPENMRRSCHTYGREERATILQFMLKSRVMLAPSLVDGVPNTMYEAMAAGALPIVSPLETILPIVRQEENVLFARNLYPTEIAEALVRAMTDDRLVDAAAEKNLALINRVANRETIRLRVIDFYESLAKQSQAATKGRKLKNVTS
jgi:Glycosyl transferases group 1